MITIMFTSLWSIPTPMRTPIHMMTIFTRMIFHWSVGFILIHTNMKRWSILMPICRICIIGTRTNRRGRRDKS